MATTVYPIHAGVNENARRQLLVVEPASIADDATIVFTVPAEFIGRASIPHLKAVWNYGAGAVGARTATFQPIINIGSALVGCEFVSFVETTGVCTVTNRSGAAMVNTHMIVEVFDDILLT